jgi:hypothetical protein
MGYPGATGFSGNRDDTWDRFPALLGLEVADWDIFTLGYATTFLPDIDGIWSADPVIRIIGHRGGDLPVAATSPALPGAARSQRVRLIWVALTHAGYEVTEIY